MEEHEVTRPLPILTLANRGFWEAAKKHELRLQRCLECRHFYYPISEMCPHCHSMDYEWALTSGRGVIDSWIVYQQPLHPYFNLTKVPHLRVPYAVVQVQLEEGPRLFGNLLGTDPKDIKAGMRVEVVFEDVNAEVTLPQWRRV